MRLEDDSIGSCVQCCDNKREWDSITAQAEAAAELASASERIDQVKAELAQAKSAAVEANEQFQQSLEAESAKVISIGCTLLLSIC